MRSTGCEHVAAPPMVLHSPQSGECGLAVLGECRSVGRVGEGTWFWLLGFVKALLAPVADVGGRLGLWLGRRFFFHCCRWRCRCRWPRCHNRHIHRPRRRRPGSFFPLAFPLAGRFRVGGFLNFSFQLSTFNFSSISPSFSSSGVFCLAWQLIHFPPLSRPIQSTGSRRVRPRAVACSYAARVTYRCFLCMASPEIFRLAAGGRRVLPCPRFRASTRVNGG